MAVGRLSAAVRRHPWWAQALVIWLLVAAVSWVWGAYRTDPAAARQLRTEVPRLLTLDARLDAVPDAEPARSADLHDPGRCAIRAAMVQRTWSPSVQAMRRAQLRNPPQCSPGKMTTGSGTATVVSDAVTSYVTMVVVTRWEQQTVHPTHARLVVIAHQETWNGLPGPVSRWTVLPDQRYYLELTRVAKMWRLTHVAVREVAHETGSGL